MYNGLLKAIVNQTHTAIGTASGKKLPARRRLDDTQSTIVGLKEDTKQGEIRGD